MAENVKETRESGPKWEKIAAQEFLLEIERSTDNASPEPSYAFDEIHISPPSGIQLPFSNVAYRFSPDKRFVIIGNRGEGGKIVREISVFTSSIQDPTTVIKVKRASLKEGK